MAKNYFEYFVGYKLLVFLETAVLLTALSTLAHYFYHRLVKVIYRIWRWKLKKITKSTFILKNIAFLYMVYCVCNRIKMGILSGHYVLNLMYFSSHVMLFAVLDLILPVDMVLHNRRKVDLIHAIRLGLMFEFYLINMLFYSYCMSYPRGDCLALMLVYYSFVMELFLRQIVQATH